MSAFVVMGDSAAAGVGDQIDDGIYKGWGHYLFQSIPNLKEYHNISRPGARVTEMATVQLPVALEIKPKLTIFIIGGNDVLRNNFNPNQMYKDLVHVIRELRNSGSEVYAMNLHDPGKIIPLPNILKKVLQRRVRAVNEIYKQLNKEFDLKLLDILSKEDVYDKKFWHVDRMHPNRAGHQKLATYFAEILRLNKFKASPIYIDTEKRTRKIENWKWMLYKGTPWFLKRSIDLFPVMTFLSICEILGLTNRIAPEFKAFSLTDGNLREIA
ncbi:MAG: hypothetical protein RIQ86_182 [Actinomycetota bacterium]|jgi:lysophospholipase L1-like esterase